MRSLSPKARLPTASEQRAREKRRQKMAALARAVAVREGWSGEELAKEDAEIAAEIERRLEAGAISYGPPPKYVAPPPAREDGHGLF